MDGTMNPGRRRPLPCSVCASPPQRRGFAARAVSKTAFQHRIGFACELSQNAADCTRQRGLDTVGFDEVHQLLFERVLNVDDALHIDNFLESVLA